MCRPPDPPDAGQPTKQDRQDYSADARLGYSGPERPTWRNGDRMRTAPCHRSVMTTPHPTQSTVPTHPLARTESRRRRSGRRNSIIALAALTATMTASGWSADAAPKMKRIKVAFSVVPAVGKIGAPVCTAAGCLLVAEPNAAGGASTGDWISTGVATQAISLRPAGAPPPNAVSVLSVFDGTVKGCEPGTIVFSAVFDDYSNLSSGKGGRGTWTLLPKTGTGGMVGATGSGTMVEILNADFSTKMIDHIGTISCRPA